LIISAAAGSAIATLVERSPATSCSPTSDANAAHSAVAVMAAEKLAVQLACRVFGVSESGYYEWRGRAPSQRAIRHAWLTDLIREVHAESRGTYGGRRVHADLTLGPGVVVGHGAVEMLMRQAGIVGAIGRPKSRRSPPENIAGDLVKRAFARSGPNQLWSQTLRNIQRGRGKFAVARYGTSTPAGSSAGLSMPHPFWSRMQVELLDRRR
jgi:hypothetical protein